MVVYRCVAPRFLPAMNPIPAGRVARMHTPAPCAERCPLPSGGARRRRRGRPPSATRVRVRDARICHVREETKPETTDAFTRSRTRRRSNARRRPPDRPTSTIGSRGSPTRLGYRCGRPRLTVARAPPLRPNGRMSKIFASVPRRSLDGERSCTGQARLAQAGSPPSWLAPAAHALLVLAVGSGVSGARPGQWQ
jgi:hypothetical protein